MKRDLPDIEELLREWGRFFRDRHRWMRCGSAEGDFMPGSRDFIQEGWGSPTTPEAPKPKGWILRACETQDALTRLSKADGGRVLVWAITYYYAYPYLEKRMVLRIMRKYVGKRINWEAFVVLKDTGAYKVAAYLA